MSSCRHFTFQPSARYIYIKSNQMTPNCMADADVCIDSMTNSVRL